MYIYIFRAVHRLDRARNMLRNAAAASNGDERRSPSSSINNGICQAAASESLHLFEEGMLDDLNAPRASSGLFLLIKAAEKVGTALSFHVCRLFLSLLLPSSPHGILFHMATNLFVLCDYSIHCFRR